MSDTTKDLLAQTGGKSAKFDTVGDAVSGPIIATQVVQVRNFQTGDPETWDNGDPKQQIVITIKTGITDPTDPDDDGVRSIYVKWWGLQRRALQDAVKKAGDDDIRVGGTFTAAYVADGEQKQRGFNPPKIYEYSYQPPSATAGLMQQPTQQVAPVAVAQPAAPAPAAASAPAAAPADPAQLMAQIKGLIALGMTDAQITAAVGQPAEAIAAIRALPAA